jgi:hypothetical protein
VVLAIGEDASTVNAILISTDRLAIARFLSHANAILLRAIATVFERERELSPSRGLNRRITASSMRGSQVQPGMMVIGGGVKLLLS